MKPFPPKIEGSDVIRRRIAASIDAEGVDDDGAPCIDRLVLAQREDGGWELAHLIEWDDGFKPVVGGGVWPVSDRLAAAIRAEIGEGTQ